MNSAVWPRFKVVFVKKSTYRSCEQCTGPTKKHSRQHKRKHWEKNVVSKQTLNVGCLKKEYFNVLMVVVVAYCVRYIILLYCLYYFNVLNVKIKPLIFGAL